MLSFYPAKGITIRLIGEKSEHKRKTEMVGTRRGLNFGGCWGNHHDRTGDGIRSSQDRGRVNRRQDNLGSRV